MRQGAGAAVVAVVLLALAPQLAPVSATSAPTVASGFTKMFGEKLDSVFGLDETIVSADGPATAEWDGTRLVVTYSNPVGGTPATVSLAPKLGDPLVLGSYSTAFPDPDPSHPGFQFGTCMGGGFEVLEIDPVVTPGVASTVTTFAASFGCYLETNGQIRVNSSLGITAFGFAVDSVESNDLGVDVDPSVGLNQLHHVTLTWGGSDPVTLGAVALIKDRTGNYRTGWSIVSDQCSGRTLSASPTGSCTVDVLISEWVPGVDSMYLRIPSNTTQGLISIRLHANVRALTFVPVKPTRIVDTRIGLGIPSSLANRSWRTLVAVNRTLGDPTRNVPPEALAVAGNLTVTKQTSAGFVSLTTIPTNFPKTSTVNVPLGDTRANGVMIRFGGVIASNGAVGATWVGAPGSKADIIFDVTGYFIQTPPPASPRSGNYRSALSPFRAVDSRIGQGLVGALVAGQTRTITLTLPGDATATAVAGNLTVVNPSAAGWISIGPDAAEVGETSAINFPAHDTRANNVIVRLGPGRTLKIKYSAKAGSTANVLFDVTGTFGGSGTSGFVPLVQNRILDTRTFNQPLYSGNPASTVDPFGKSADLSMSLPGNSAGELFITQAVVGNVTMVAPTKAGYVTIMGRDRTEPPTTSTINAPADDVRANGFVIDTSWTWYLPTYFRSAPGGTTHLLIDTTGYFIALLP
jgi:hypothetical protein